MTRVAVLDQINSAIGPVVVRLVQLNQEITLLSERLAGAMNPNVADYQQALAERRAELETLKEQLRQLRLRLIDAYESDMRSMEIEIQNTLDAFTIEELTHLKHEVQGKVNQLKKLVYENKG